MGIIILCIPTQNDGELLMVMVMAVVIVVTGCLVKLTKGRLMHHTGHKINFYL